MRPGLYACISRGLAYAPYSDLLAMGYQFQFITLAGFHALNQSMFSLAHGYAREDMSAYVLLQFGGQRRFAWQDAMAAELRQALSRLPAAPGAVLAGRYLSTDRARCDVENRLFTNPGTSSFPKGLAAIRFERGFGPLPPPPVPVGRVAGHLYYYWYRLGGAWRSWEPAGLLARWHRVTRRARPARSPSSQVQTACTRRSAASYLPSAGHSHND